MKTGNLSWSEITLGTYAAIDTLRRATVSDNMQRDITLLSMLTGIDENYFEREIHLSQLTKERNAMHKFLSLPMEFKFNPIFKCNGRKYYVEPLLSETPWIVEREISMMKIDEENIAVKLNMVMAVLANEKTTWRFWRKKLSYEQKTKDFENHMKVPTAIAVTNFFFRRSEMLLPLVLETVNRSMSEMTEKIRLMKN